MEKILISFLLMIVLSSCSLNEGIENECFDPDDLPETVKTYNVNLQSLFKRIDEDAKLYEILFDVLISIPPLKMEKLESLCKLLQLSYEDYVTMEMLSPCGVQNVINQEDLLESKSRVNTKIMTHCSSLMI